MKINFLGAVRDSNGYAEFARNFVMSMHKAGADLTVEAISFERDYVDHGPVGELCSKLIIKKHDNPDVNIINMVPKVFRQLSKKNCMNIGFTMFETTRIPDIWVRQCNEMDAILVPSTWNAKVFRDSGVTVPVAVAPPALSEKFYGPIEAPTVPRVMQQYVFYTIFQWTERKNPLGLIKAYWAAFTGNRDVRLVLKVYRKDYSKEQVNELTKEIAKLKDSMNLKHYPQIVPMFRKLSSQEIMNLHINSDCFVLPHRSEGWGLPHMEAMALGKPVIATGFSGNMDFMTEENSYLLDYHLTPVCNMKWIGPWYDGDMLWAEPNTYQLMEKMKHVYNNREDAIKVGERARADILGKHTQENSGENMLEEVNRLYENWRVK